jgi:hypothetical protein
MALAERLGRSEPDVPSITIPLQHEHTITTHPDTPNDNHPIRTRHPADRTTGDTPRQDRSHLEPLMPSVDAPDPRAGPQHDDPTSRSNEQPIEDHPDDTRETARRWPTREHEPAEHAQDRGLDRCW